jgi:hypothetical protein
MVQGELKTVIQNKEELLQRAETELRRAQKIVLTHRGKSEEILWGHVWGKSEGILSFEGCNVI